MTTRTIISQVTILVVGVTLGFAWGSQSRLRALLDQHTNQESNDLISRMNTLSQLRLGRTADAIDSLEAPIETQVINIAFAENSKFTLDFETMPKHRFHALQMAKAYREIYPAAGPNRISPHPSVVFGQVPSLTVLSMRKECTGSFCTLLKSHSTPETQIPVK